MFKIFERLLGVAVIAPPLYIMFRFIRWYSRHGQAQGHAQEEAAQQ
jgi:hypothetical protein